VERAKLFSGHPERNDVSPGPRLPTLAPWRFLAGEERPPGFGAEDAAFLKAYFGTGVVGPRFDPVRAPLRARASRRIERGRRWRADVLLARVKSCPDCKAAV